MWYGQATTALTSWADKEINKMKISNTQRKIAEYKPIVVTENKPIITKTTVKSVYSRKGVKSEYVPTYRILELREQGYTQLKIAHLLGMNRKAVHARLSRHKEA